MPNTKYLLAIHRGLNLTTPRYQKLRRHFKGDWEACFRAKPIDWAATGIDKRGLEKWFNLPQTPDPETEESKLQQCGAEVLVLGTESYPIALQHIPSPPVMLFVRGQITDEDWPGIAVVGSRRVSQYGKRALEKILPPVAKSGLTVVSGLAYGVDTLAHEIALENNARTIAVLGCGIDEIYPQRNQKLVNKIINEQRGAVISEYLPGTKARPEYFPVRNRIIAGLTQGTLVVEAALKSGSLITAQYATEFGREVLAVPGEIFSPNAAGTNHLLRDGAHPALSGAEVLSVLGITNIPAARKINLPTQGIESDILKAFGNQSKQHIDDLTRNSGFPGTTISSNLMLMEMKGWVKNMGGQVYVKNV